MKGGLTDAAVLRLTAGVREAVTSLHADSRRSLALECEVDALASRTCELELRADAFAADREELLSLCRVFKGRPAGASEAVLTATLARLDTLEARVCECEARAREERGSLARAAEEAGLARLDAAEARREAGIAKLEAVAATAAVAALQAQLEALTQAHRSSASNTLRVLEDQEGRISAVFSALQS